MVIHLTQSSFSDTPNKVAFIFRVTTNKSDKDDGFEMNQGRDFR